MLFTEVFSEFEGKNPLRKGRNHYFGRGPSDYDNQEVNEVEGHEG